MLALIYFFIHLLILYSVTILPSMSKEKSKLKEYRDIKMVDVY